MADAILAAAETLALWTDGDLDYPDLAEDITIEARLAPQLTEEITDLDERTAPLLHHADPHAIRTSARASPTSPPRRSFAGSATRTGSPPSPAPGRSPAPAGRPWSRPRSAAATPPAARRVRV
jgi:hypothetical protein